MMEEVSKVVRKIANYVHNQSEVLTEEEFRILDNVNAKDLAEIVYKKRINFARFLKNADEMIDIYNESLMWAQIKEVKGLKKCLINPAPFVNKNPIVPAKPIQQRELPREIINEQEQPILEVEQEQPILEVEHEQQMQDVEQEILQLDNVRDIDQNLELTHIDDDIGRTVPNMGTFVSNLLAEPSLLSKSIPMHRDFVRPTQHITLDKNRDVGYVPENFEDDMPILNESQIAQLGFFDGDQGRKISEILLRRDQPDFTSNPILDVPPPNIDSLQELPINEPLNIEEPPLNTVYDEINDQMNALHMSQQPVEIPIPEQDVENIENLPQPSQQSENQSQLRDSMAERYDSFRKAVDAAEHILNKVKKRVRRPMRPHRLEENDNNEVNLLKLRKEVVSKLKRRQRARPCKFPKRINLSLNFFEDIDVYLLNDLPFEENIIEISQADHNRQSDFALEFNQINRGFTSTPMAKANDKKRSNKSPENSQISKKMRTFEQPIEREPEDLENPSGLSIPNLPDSVVASGLTISNLPVQDSNILAPIIEIPEPPPNEPLPSLIEIPIVQESVDNPRCMTVQQSLDQELDVPQMQKETSIPMARRQSRLDLIQNLQLSAASVDYNRLRRNSKLRKTPVDSRSQISPNYIFQNACENISEREALKVRNNRVDNAPRPDQQIEEPIPQEQELDIPIVQTSNFDHLNKKVINDEIHLEMKSNDGTQSLWYTEHQLKCVLLYLKIRTFVAALKKEQPWRISMDEIFELLKDSGDQKFVIYQRILFMVSKKLFIGHFSDNTLLEEIEIPLDRYENSIGKENVLQQFLDK